MIPGKPLRLGIVGGLGALAGADLLHRIVETTP
ncbi:MAG TPA: aspartate racemase, partial [Rhizobiales bacterium]|nr:aspartate racemase [Hyphomicrobiales bacterium]